MLLYRLITFCYLVFVFPIKLILLKETREYLKLRLKANSKNLNLKSKDVYIFHAASGEAEYALPIIRKLKKLKPDSQIVMTYFSSSYIDVLQVQNEIDVVFPLPLDLPGPTLSFLKLVKPKALLISRTDLWPELLTQAKNLKIPTFLFSRTQKPITSKIKKNFYAWIYKKINFISAVTQEDKTNILNIYSKAKVFVHGDSRWDQVQYKLTANTQVQYLKPTLVAGSIWPEDFPFLAPAWDKKFGQLILVPHEKDFTFFKEIKKYFSEKGYIVKFFSDLGLNINFEKLNLDFDILVIDKFGILPRLYSNSYMSFIGGSFKDKVHSVMESLACNTPVIVGPYHQNNREAELFKKIPIEPDSKIKAVNIAQNSQDIRNLIQTMHKNHLKSKPQFMELQGSASELFVKDLIGLGL